VGFKPTILAGERPLGLAVQRGYLRKHTKCVRVVCGLVSEQRGCTVLTGTAPHCEQRCCTVLTGTAPHCEQRCCTVLTGTAPHCEQRGCTVLTGIAPHCEQRGCKVLTGTAPHCEQRGCTVLTGTAPHCASNSAHSVSCRTLRIQNMPVVPRYVTDDVRARCNVIAHPFLFTLAFGNSCKLV